MPSRPPYLLQGITQFEITSNPLDAVGFIIVLALFAALIIYMNVSKAVRNSVVFSRKGVNIKKMRGPLVNARFYKVIANAGLDKKQAFELQKILSVDGDDPLAILYNRAKVDIIFGRVYRNLLQEGRFEDIQQKLLEFFAIRNGVEYLYACEKNENGNQAARGFRRIQVDINCAFYLVAVKNVRVKMRRQKKLSVVPDPRYSGKIMDVSQGGCAVAAGQNIAAGSFIKIEFVINKRPVAALGKILRLNKSGSSWIYHVIFLKMSKISVVMLNTLIFGYK